MGVAGEGRRAQRVSLCRARSRSGENAADSKRYDVAWMGDLYR